MDKSKWQLVDRNGNNLTAVQVVTALRRIGATDQVIDWMKPGSIYENGNVWFQRIA